MSAYLVLIYASHPQQSCYSFLVCPPDVLLRWILHEGRGWVLRITRWTRFHRWLLLLRKVYDFHYKISYTGSGVKLCPRQYWKLLAAWLDKLKCELTGYGTHNQHPRSGTTALDIV